MILPSRKPTSRAASFRNVRLAQRAENRVADRVHQYVGIRMAFQTLRVRDLHPAQDEFSPLDQGMHVITNANMNHAENHKATPGWNQGVLVHPGSLCLDGKRIA